jgi:hypothetical protein
VSDLLLRWFEAQRARAESELKTLGVPKAGWKSMRPFLDPSGMVWEYQLSQTKGRNGRVETRRKATLQLGERKGGRAAKLAWAWAELASMANEAIGLDRDSQKRFHAEMSRTLETLNQFQTTKERSMRAARAPRQRRSPRTDAVRQAVLRLSAEGVTVNAQTVKKYLADNNGPAFSDATLRSHVSRAKRASRSL